jgi:hypothetical protein
MIWHPKCQTLESIMIVTMGSMYDYMYGLGLGCDDAILASIKI